MNYPLIKKFLPGLYITENYSEDVVYAEHLEAELAKGVEMFGDNRQFGVTAVSDARAITHSGLLIGYRPIESSKPVSREEILAELEKAGKESHNSHSVRVIVSGLYHRIKENGVE